MNFQDWFGPLGAVPPCVIERLSPSPFLGFLPPCSAPFSYFFRQKQACISFQLPSTHSQWELVSPQQILEAASKLGDSGWEYAMEASFIEVYNETLRDLLAEGRNPRDAGKVLDNNAIKHMADGAPGPLPTHPSPPHIPRSHCCLLRMLACLLKS